MKLNHSTEKALAVIAILSTQKKGTCVSSKVIIDRLKISESYTKKLLRKLVIANIIHATPGNNGGFELNIKPKDLNLLQIIEAIEGKIDTYPDYGTFKNAFTDFNTKVKDSESVMKNIFAKADMKWQEEIKQQSVENILHEIFDNEYVTVDWNNIK